MTFQEKLKTNTKELHDKSENHPFHVELISGKLPDQKYFLYLQNMFPIVSYLERRMGLDGELIRSPLMHVDIMQYSKDGCYLTANDMHYFEWINEISQKEDKWLPAILYVEWLKDAYGGQIIAKNLKYNSTLKYANIKNVVQKIRSYIKVESEEEDQFIQEVNKVYENHNKILDKIME